MPGASYAQTVDGGLQGPPNLYNALVAKNLNGTTFSGTTYYPTLVGDLVVLTRNTNLTTNSVPVVRSLLQADITAAYEQSDVVCGIYGVAADSVSTNSAGQSLQVPVGYGGVVYSVPNQSFAMKPDLATAFYKNRINLASSNAFAMTIDLSLVILPFTLSQQFTPGVAAVSISLTNGVSTYMVDTTNSTTTVLEIVEPLVNNPGYNTTFTTNPGPGLGPSVVVRILAAYQQNVLGVTYSTH